MSRTDHTEATASETSAAPVEAGPEHNPSALWSGDTGTLGERTRRVLLELLKGPYVSGV